MVKLLKTAHTVDYGKLNKIPGAKKPQHPPRQKPQPRQYRSGWNGIRTDSGFCRAFHP